MDLFPVDDDDLAKIEALLTNHPPVEPIIIAGFEGIRAGAKAFARVILANVPAEAPERDLALTLLRFTSQTAVAGLALNQEAALQRLGDAFDRRGENPGPTSQDG